MSKALLSGVFGAIGGLFAKLSSFQFFEHQLTAYAAQLACFAFMLLFNSSSLLLYVKALHEDTSFTATVVTSSVTFILSGLFGVLIFNEITGFIWWSGISLILLGILLIQTSPSKIKTE